MHDSLWARHSRHHGARPHTQDWHVKKLVVLMGTTLGSSLGWWLGSPGGIMGSFIVSMIGFGVGMYYAARFAQRLDN